MSTTGAGQALARRKRLITTIVAAGVLVTGVGVAVAYWRGRSATGKGLPSPPTLPTDVHQQLSGYSFTRSEGGRQVFTIRASKLVAFKQGEPTVLEDVVIELFGRTGSRHDLLRTARCKYNTQSGDVFASGPVHIELNTQAAVLPGAGQSGWQRVQLETSGVSYRHQDAVMESRQPVKFQVGRLVGSGQGLSYGAQTGQVELKRDVVMELHPRPEADSQLPVHLSASRLRYDKEKGTVTLSGPIVIVRGPRRLEAQSGTVLLNHENRITRITLQGGVRSVDTTPGSLLEITAQHVEGVIDPAGGQLTSVTAEGTCHVQSRQKDTLVSLTAERVNVAFAGTHPRPTGGSAQGDVVLVMNAVGPEVAKGNGSSLTNRAERRSLAANQVEFTLRPGGRSLKDAHTVGPGKLVLASTTTKAGTRIITAGQFQMQFDDRSRLQTLLGLDHTRVLVEPAQQAPPGALPQETTADRLEARFDPVLQTLQSMVQTGDFHFREGDRQATADQASYLDQTQTMTLTGHPEAWDRDTRMKAEHILIELRKETAEGLGNVQSTYTEDTKSAQGKGGAVPTNVLAERARINWKSQVIHYEGNVRAWRGQDVIESPSLDMYRAERRLRSGYKVLSSHLQSASLIPGKATEPSSTPETRPVTVGADHLEYLESERRARYQGDVELRTEGTTLRAQRLDLYFSPAAGGDAGKVERAVAEGKVKVVQPGRWATGEHADYFAEAGKIVVTGGPPVLYDEEKGLTTGQQLTFFLHDDSLTVEGGGSSPTLTKHRVAR